jgi:signal transduction histidine kinase
MAISDQPAEPAFTAHEGPEETLAASAQARLRALDAMLGGVAHDLNNALSVVLMNLDVMQQDAALMNKHGRRIDGMLDAMTGASALVRHLLNFSHSRRPEPEVVSIAESLPALLELIQVAVGKEIDIAVAPGEPGPCCVMVDLASFEVAVVHAAFQLAAAMPGGGVLTFQLGSTVPDDQIVLALDAEARGPQPRAAHNPVDLKLLEHFARDAHGRVSGAMADGRLARVEIRLPACAATTV